MRSAVIAAVVVFLCGVGYALAQGVAADGPRQLSVVKTDVGVCNTDGGKVACPTGMKFLAEAFTFNANEDLQKTPIHCGPGKPQKAQTAILYEYNDGQFVVPEADEKALAKQPACVKEGYVPRAKAKLHELFQKVREVDPRVDVRATFRMYLQLKPAAPGVTPAPTKVPTKAPTKTPTKAPTAPAKT
jgi:hypothetical protein